MTAKTPSPLPLPAERLSTGNLISRTWWRALNAIAGQALGGTVTQINTGPGIKSNGPIIETGMIELEVPISIENGGTGLTGPYRNGQLLIGNGLTGKLNAKTLTAGANVTITNSPGAITIAATGGGILGVVTIVTGAGNVFFQ